MKDERLRPVKSPDDFAEWLRYYLLKDWDNKKIWKYEPPPSPIALDGEDYLIHNQPVDGRNNDDKTR